MKKLITFVSVVFFGMLTTYAQNADLTTTLEKTRVIYLTADTVSQEDGDLYPWCVNELPNTFGLVDMPFEGVSDEDWNYQVAFRNDYTDPETGFTLKKGYYRGITLYSETLNLNGVCTNMKTNKNTDNSRGFKNLKKVILYYVCLPDAKCSSNGYNYNHNACPSNGGRVFAQYINTADGTPLSNRAYRDPSIGVDYLEGMDEEYFSSLGWMEYVKTFKNYGCGFEMMQDDSFTNLHYNPALVTTNQPFKFSVDLTNSLPSSEYDAFFESETKKSEFKKLPIDGLTELETSYYFADAKDCNPYSDNPESDAMSATGYNCYADRWGKKVDWTPETAIKIGIKGRLYLVGFALVSATEGAETEYLNTFDYMSARFTTEPTAAAGNPINGEMPENPWADRVGKQNEEPPVVDGIANIPCKVIDAPAYNLQGQRVKDSHKGIVVKEGRKIMK